MANVLTLKITYADCGNKIWREVQISDNAYLCDLGYVILASFDTLAYHLFHITYNGVIYDLPDDEVEIDLENCIFSHKLRDLSLKVGDKLEMVYDFGCEQIFDIKILEVLSMPKGAGRAYPKILQGEGKGIIEDISAEETLKIIKRIDKTGKTNHYYLDKYENRVLWDYRDYKLEIDNLLLKGEISKIAEGYSYFKQFIE